jgi:hypothetical protein
MWLKRNRRTCFFILVLFALVVAGCAHQPVPDGTELPGFFSGFLHGFLIIFSFVGSLFTDVRIYSFPNAGRWYDFGYLIGAILFIGGASS